jgi:hypothetical protein
MQCSMNLLVVYLGTKIPTYAVSNLIDIKARFSKHQLYLVCDDSRVASKVQKRGINILQVEKDSSFKRLFEEKSDLPSDFRNGFWYYTIARFSALKEAQRILSSPVIQIEADVWLADNFPFDKFTSLREEIAFSLETPDKGSASILYLKNFAAAEKLQVLAESMLYESPKDTDMVILGKICSRKLMRARILPTLAPCDLAPHEDKMPFRESDIKFFGGIFDALPYGMCLLGEDPRNHRGRIKVNQVLDHQIIPKRNFDFELSLKGDLFLIDKDGKSVPLFNLHNHSKNKELWKNQTKRLLTKRIKRRRRNKHVYYRLDLPVFLLQALVALKRRFTRAKKK